MLRYAVSDADTMMDVLKSIGGVSDSDGLLLVNPDRRNLISAMNKIKSEISGIKQKNERIEFIFYYSGHSDDEAILLGREKIYYKELKEAIRGIPADVRIAILDSCSSGAFTRIKGGKFRPPFILDSSFNMKGDAFMTSSSSNEASQESGRAIRGSFFTYYLVSGLRGAADMIQDGRITLNEAYQYAYNETLMRTEKTMGALSTLTTIYR
ncbi:MAG: caspase family protein [Desulfobacterales bacterium]|nr:caspase family protein [Desulfobacterales bacterium]